VNANWNPDDGRLNVNADDPDNSNSNLGCRLSRRLFGACMHCPYSWWREPSLFQVPRILDPTLRHFATFYDIFLKF